MSKSLGKDFEVRFKKDWIKCFGEESIDRIYDSVSGFKSISNISDFICYKYPYIFFLEVKSIRGNTFSIPFRQYEKLLKKKGTEGIFAGIVIWFIEKEKACFVSIEETERLIGLGYKSINCDKMIGKEDFEKVVEIPSKLKRTFLELDLTSIYKYMEQEQLRKKGEINNG